MREERYCKVSSRTEVGHDCNNIDVMIKKSNMNNRVIDLMNTKSVKKKMSHTNQQILYRHGKCAITFNSV